MKNNQKKSERNDNDNDNTKDIADDNIHLFWAQKEKKIDNNFFRSHLAG